MTSPSGRQWSFAEWYERQERDQGVTMPHWWDGRLVMSAAIFAPDDVASEPGFPSCADCAVHCYPAAEGGSFCGLKCAPNVMWVEADGCRHGPMFGRDVENDDERYG